MALQQHIESLKQKHAHIKNRIHEEESHLSHDELLLHSLKCQKLKLKDEIERLQHAEGPRQAA
jgi:hypothetical protein